MTGPVGEISRIYSFTLCNITLAVDDRAITFSSVSLLYDRLSIFICFHFYLDT